MSTISVLATTISGNASNVTLRPIFVHDFEVDIVSDQYKSAAVTMGAINSFFSILVNLILLITIMSSKEMRKNFFYLNIIGLSIAGLLSGTFIVPSFTSRYHMEQWLHGFEYCEIFTALSYVQLFLPGVSLICLNIERFMALHVLHNPMTCLKRLHTTPVKWILLVASWVCSVCICLPLLLEGRREGFFGQLAAKYCFHVLKTNYAFALLGIVLIGPYSILIIATIISLVHFKVFSYNWKRMADQDNGDRQFEEMVSTIKSTLISSTLFIVAWSPFLFFIFGLLICMMHRLRCTKLEGGMISTQICACAASFLSQFPWLLLPDLRLRILGFFRGGLSVRSLVENVRKKFSNNPLIVEWTPKQSELMEENAVG